MSEALFSEDVITSLELVGNTTNNEPDEQSSVAPVLSKVFYSGAVPVSIRRKEEVISESRLLRDRVSSYIKGDVYPYFDADNPQAVRDVKIAIAAMADNHLSDEELSRIERIQESIVPGAVQLKKTEPKTVPRKLTAVQDHLEQLHDNSRRRSEWVGWAACGGVDPDIFHFRTPKISPDPSPGHLDRVRKMVAEPLSYCEKCAVESECLEYGNLLFSKNQKPGYAAIYGGRLFGIIGVHKARFAEHGYGDILAADTPRHIEKAELDQTQAEEVPEE